VKRTTVRKESLGRPRNSSKDKMCMGLRDGRNGHRYHIVSSGGLWLTEVFTCRVTLPEVKVKFPLCLNKQHAMTTHWGSGGRAPRIVTSALDGGEWPVSRSGSFTPRERVPGTHWIGG
jgi:hypothetical protein